MQHPPPSMVTGTCKVADIMLQCCVVHMPTPTIQIAHIQPGYCQPANRQHK